MATFIRDAHMPPPNAICPFKSQNWPGCFNQLPKPQLKLAVDIRPTFARALVPILFFAPLSNFLSFTIPLKSTPRQFPPSSSTIILVTIDP